MIDPACELRTWLDALHVGCACDGAGCFWYEDPYRDGGVSAAGHRRLREKLGTPLLVSEHVRGLEQKAMFLLAGGCDMIHAAPEYDMGITGAIKIAHSCGAIGLDVQFHACGMPNAVPPAQACGHSDQPEGLGADGCVPVPDGPGLGLTYDWAFIERNRRQHHVFA